MAFTYTLIISTTQPTDTTLGIVWINPTLSEMRIRTGDWTLITVGNCPITSYVAGTYIKTLIIQETKPTYDVGQIWLRDSAQQLYVCFDDWIAY